MFGVGLLKGFSVADFLDELIQAGARELPKRNVPGEPVLPRRSPTADESVFVRHCAWVDVLHCACGQTHRRFDVLMEERNWLAPSLVRGTKHFIRPIPTPKATQLINPVLYERHHNIDACEVCLNIDQFKLADDEDAST